MIRTCKYCGWEYDTKKDSQSYCPSNPRRRKQKPSIVIIAALQMPNDGKFPKSKNN